MDRNHFYIIFLITLIKLSRCAPEEDSRSKRIVLDDNYYTIINELHNLSKEVEILKSDNIVLKSENAVLSQQIHDIKAVKNVAFRATLTTTITGGKRQVIIFNRVDLNIGNAYNVIHGNFIAPGNGTYLFSLYACSDSRHFIVLDLMRNSAIVGQFLSGDSDNSGCNSRTFILELKKGDDIYVSQGSYGDYLLAHNTYGYPHFSGVLLSAS